MRTWLAGLLLAAAAVPVDARTWRVEKDGSGDFMVIQDGIDAAAEGDTIRIGPGRFDDFSSQVVGSGNSAYSIGWLRTNELTLVGAGLDLTTIGPASAVVEIGGLQVGGLYLARDVISHIQGLTIENVKFPVTVLHESTVAQCRIRSTDEWVALALLVGGNVGISDCIFEGSSTSILTGSPDVTWPVIERCQFYNSGPVSSAVVIGNGATNALIRDCDFYGSAVGVSVQLSGSASIEDCDFLGTQLGAIDMDQGVAIVRRCRVQAGARFPLRVNNGRLEVYDSVIGGGELATILVAGDMFVRNSHIMNGGALSVDSRGSASRVVDLAQNWWGTTDLNTIQGWISQLNPNVIYQPILDKPVSTRVESLSQLKARFAQPLAGDGN